MTSVLIYSRTGTPVAAAPGLMEGGLSVWRGGGTGGGTFLGGEGAAHIDEMLTALCE